MKHLRGGRKAALIVGLAALLTLGLAPSAMAAAGAGTGAGTFCLSNGECGTTYLNVNYVNVVDRGGVVAWECSATLPSTSVNFVGITITECVASNNWTGTDHYGIQNGNAGPTTATAGGSTTNEEGGSYTVCMKGIAFYVGGSYPFSDCSSLLIHV